MSENNVLALVKGINKKSSKDIATVGITYADPDRLSTGYFALDLATGGGVPIGRVSIIYGPESSMKTTLALKLIANAKKRWPEKKAVFIDVEGHMSKSWAAAMGVDVDKLIYILPENAESVVDMVEAFTQAEDISVLALDSLAAMVTNHELNSDADIAPPIQKSSAPGIKMAVAIVFCFLLFFR